MLSPQDIPMYHTVYSVKCPQCDLSQTYLDLELATNVAFNHRGHVLTFTTTQQFTFDFAGIA